MCKHMADGGDCKDEDASAAETQILKHVRYTTTSRLSTCIKKLVILTLDTRFY
jgi:hypothetical protein